MLIGAMDRKRAVFLFFSVICWGIAIAPGTARGTVTVTPSSAVVEGGKQSSVKVQYNIKSSALCLQAVSSSGRFLGGNKVLGTINQQVSATLSPDPLRDAAVGAVSETLAVTKAVLEKAEADKLKKITFVRTFRLSGSCAGASEQVSLRINLRPAKAGRFEIIRVRLYFENGRPDISVMRNEAVGGLTAELSFTGSGLLRGYWELDGRRIDDVSEHLREQKRIRLSLAGSRRLPSFRPGLHRVGLRITEPDQNINGPEALYFVTSAMYSDETKKPPEYVPHQLIVLIGNGNPADEIVKMLSAKYDLSPVEDYRFGSIGYRMILFRTRGNAVDLIRSLTVEKGIESIQTNNIFRTMSEPMNDMQQIVRELNFVKLHRSLTGRGTIVAVIDSGVDTGHRDLAGRVAYFENMVGGDTYRAELHGTAVAGLIAASINGFGIEGVAPDSKIVALRACRQITKKGPEGECYTFSVAKALDRAVQKKAKVINMSFGAPHAGLLLKRVIVNAAAGGVLFTASAGNSPSSRIQTFPASLDEVISVGGVDESGYQYPNSDVASASDIILPAKGLFTTIPGDGHNFFDGTSMSSAVAAGLVALALEKHGDIRKSDLFPFRGDICQWEEKYLGVRVCGQ